jgi:hypothetical protein
LDAFGVQTARDEMSFATLYARIFIPAIAVGLIVGGVLFFTHDNGQALPLIAENVASAWQALVEHLRR